MSISVFSLMLQGSISLVTVSYPLQIWLLWGQWQDWISESESLRGRCNYALCPLGQCCLVGYLGRGRAAWPFPSNNLTTPHTFVSTSIGYPRKIQWGWYARPWLSCLLSDLVLSLPYSAQHHGRLTLKSVFPRLSCQLPCAGVGQWEVLAVNWKVDRREKPGDFSSS